MRNLIKKKDIITALVLLIFFSLIFIIQTFVFKPVGTGVLLIVKDGFELEKMDLKDGEYIVVGKKVIKSSELKEKTSDSVNKFIIKDGTVNVLDASCPDKLCTKMKQISQVGEMIVCLPHKLYFKIEKSKKTNESELDGISN